MDVRGRRGPSDSSELPQKKAKKGKGSRNNGLRHYSTCVCQKVQEKGVTTYQEVADELVQELMASYVGDTEKELQQYQNNIKRRIYDAFNVLTAINVIKKEKDKKITWVGLPTNSEQEYQQYLDLKQKKEDSIRKTKQQLFDLILQQVAFHNLILRNEKENAEKARSRIAPTPSSTTTNTSPNSGSVKSRGSATAATTKDGSETNTTASEAADEASITKAPLGGSGDYAENHIRLPFIVVNTAKDTSVDCHMSRDKTEYMFQFSAPFEIHDDVDVLKRMRLAYGIESGTCSDEDLEKAKKIVPTAMWPYLNEMVQNGRENLRRTREEQQRLAAHSGDQPTQPAPTTGLPSQVVATTSSSSSSSSSSSAIAAMLAPPSSSSSSTVLSTGSQQPQPQQQTPPSTS